MKKIYRLLAATLMVLGFMLVPSPAGAGTGYVYWGTGLRCQYSASDNGNAGANGFYSATVSSSGCDIKVEGVWVPIGQSDDFYLLFYVDVDSNFSGIPNWQSWPAAVKKDQTVQVSGEIDWGYNGGAVNTYGCFWVGGNTNQCGTLKKLS